MIFYLTSRIISSLTAFLYPGYASYKTLSQRPASEEELERWLMYWSVLGCIVGVEYVAEWVVSWIPFYYTIKTIFLLYLALPQTQGSSYLYIHHLQPFFQTHESQIDAAIASFKSRAYLFIQERLRALWEQVAVGMGGQQGQEPQHPQPPVTGAPPSLANPASGPAQLVSSLWGSYGPSIIASGAALLRQSTGAAATRSASATQAALNTPPPTVRQDSSQSVLERRRQLEEELAALGTNSVLMPSASPRLSASRGSSEGDLKLRERVNSGKFEEIEVPSDVEGYEVGDSVGAGEGSSGYESGRPGQQKRGSSWFGWGGSSGYERVKSE